VLLLEIKKVKAIVLRINSGGGSAVASASIEHELMLAKKEGKKIIISMSNMAASGGYWISMPADKILASPFTLTGSIGVIFGKFVTRELWEKHAKVTFDSYQTHTGDNSSAFSTLDKFTDSQRKSNHIILSDLYETFKRKVSESRKLDINKVEDIAQGKVYLGSQAKALGLVDQLGGLHQAIEAAKEECKIPKTERVQIELFPLYKSPLQKLLRPPQNSEEAQSENGSVDFISGVVSTVLSPIVNAISFVISPVKNIFEFVNLASKSDTTMYSLDAKIVNDSLEF